MQPVSPVLPGSEAIEIVIGKDQPEYIPLPAVYMDNPIRMFTRWRMTDEERKAVADGADIVFCQMTFGNAFQPVRFEVVAPDQMPDLEP
jgi:hypothetical protein